MDDTNQSRDAFTRASAWVSRRGRAPWTEADEQALQAWLAADAANAAAFTDASRLYSALGKAIDPDEVVRLLARPPARRRVIPLWLTSTAAAALLMLSVGWWWSNAENSAVPPAPWQASTAPGEFRQVVLPDGSRVDLDADSQLRWLPKEDARAVQLVRGRAVFSVTHDAARPFTVSAGVSEVRVLGTIFSVALQRDAVAVAVDQGRVRVRHFTASSGTVPQEADLTPGDQALLSNILSFSHVPDGEFATWRDGLLVFRGRPLDEVVQELQRYHQRRILVDDPLVAARRLSGTFKLSEPDALLKAIATALSLEIRVDGEIIRLVDGNAQGAKLP